MSKPDPVHAHVANPVDALRGSGLRATRQRVTILQALEAERGDATAQDLYAKLRTGDDSIGLATVYRTLNSLADAGVIDRLHHGSEACYRACAPGHHHHLTCDHCHSVIEIRECDVDGWVDRVAKQHGYTKTRHTVELAGTCPRCRERGLDDGI